MRIRISSFLIAALFALVAVPAHATDPGWQQPDTLTGFTGSYTRPPFGSGNLAFVTFSGTDGYRASEITSDRMITSSPTHYKVFIYQTKFYERRFTFPYISIYISY